MMENKSAYDKPTLRKVALDVKTSVLADCNTSTNTTPAGAFSCELSAPCFNYTVP